MVILSYRSIVVHAWIEFGIGGGDSDEPFVREEVQATFRIGKTIGRST